MKSPWPTKKLGEICEIIAGQAPPSQFYNTDGRGIPFLTVNSFGNIFPKIERWTEKCLRKCTDKDVLFSVAGSLGLVNLGINACITRSIFALRPKESLITQKFLFYLLKKFGSIIARSGSGTAQKIITIEQIKSFSVPLPPLPIQQKIVKILDAIQGGVEVQEKIIEKTKELKKSLMADLFKKGINEIIRRKEEIIEAVKKCNVHKKTGERNLIRYLAVEFEKLFEGYKCDIELEKEDRRRPDIIVHERGKNNNNLLAIEVKINASLSEIENDIKKLEELMLGSYQYKYALFINYGYREIPEELIKNSKVGIIQINGERIYFIPPRIKLKKTEIGEIPEDWEVAEIGKVLDYEQPWKYIVKGRILEEKKENTIPVLTANKAFILGYTEEKENVYYDVPVIIFDDFTTDKKFVDFPFKVKSSAMKILKLKDKRMNLKVIFEIISRIKYQNIGEHKRYYLSEYQNIKIPLPSPLEQQEIAEILQIVDQKIEIEQKKKALYEELFKTMLNKIMNQEIDVEKIDI